MNKENMNKSSKKEKNSGSKRNTYHDKYEVDIDNFQVSSATECTGLIPTPPQNADELESYKELYNFGPPKMTKE